MEWQPIETAPKDGTVIILGVDFQRAGHDQVRIGYWEISKRERWIWKDKDTQIRDGYIDTSHWHVFVTIDAGAQEYVDEEDRVFIRPFDATHWMPLPKPPAKVS